MKPQIMPMQTADGYRQLLLRKKLELRNELRIEQADLVEVQEQALDRRSAVQDGSVLERLTNLDCNELNLVDEALGRIEAGTYGTCSDCGRLIGTRRLDALPWAVRCRTCEERKAALSGAV